MLKVSNFFDFSSSAFVIFTLLYFNIYNILFLCRPPEESSKTKQSVRDDNLDFSALFYCF